MTMSVPANRTDIGRTEDVVPLIEAIRPYWRRKWLIILVTAVSTASFVCYSFLATPVYRVTTIVIPASSGKGGIAGSLASALGPASGLASLAGINLSSTDYSVEETLAVLQSRQFTEPFLVDENVAPELFPQLWNKDLGKWAVVKEKQPTLGRTYVRFEKLLNIVKNIKTGLVTIQIDWPNSAQAASWLNELVRRVNLEMRARAISNADASVGYLQKEWTSTQDVNTREAVSRLIETQIRQRMLANVTQDYALRVIDKAMAADPSERVWPKKLVVTGIGFIIGFLLGICLAYVSELRRKYRAAYT
jgi:uncharacterized protein involved in exopolysaccharide biosynthesis